MSDAQQAVVDAARKVCAGHPPGRVYYTVLPEELDQLRQALARLDAEALVSEDLSRCACCGWTLAPTRKLGCVPGDCSARPLPKTKFNEARYLREKLPAAPIEGDA